MRKLIYLLIAIVVFSNVAYSFTWDNSCFNDTHVFREAEFTINDTVYTLNQTTECPNGCSSGDCAMQDVQIPLELYIFLSGVTILFIILAVVYRESPFFSWLGFVFCVVMGASTFMLDIVKCEFIGYWNCLNYHLDPIAISTLWSGLALVMLIIAIYVSIVPPIKRAVKKDEDQDAMY
jgi:hypothetical protein